MKTKVATAMLEVVQHLLSGYTMEPAKQQQQQQNKFCCKKRYVDPWNRTEDSEMQLYSHSHLYIFQETKKKNEENFNK